MKGSLREAKLMLNGTKWETMNSNVSMWLMKDVQRLKLIDEMELIEQLCEEVETVLIFCNLWEFGAGGISQEDMRVIF